MIIYSAIKLCVAKNCVRSAQLWTAKHRGGGDENYVAIADGGRQRPVLNRTVLWNTPHDICGRECRVKLHHYASPKYQADWRFPVYRQLKPLYVESGPEGEAGIGKPPPTDENSIPCVVAPAPCKVVSDGPV